MSTYALDNNYYQGTRSYPSMLKYSPILMYTLTYLPIHPNCVPYENVCSLYHIIVSIEFVEFVFVFL